MFAMSNPRESPGDATGVDWRMLEEIHERLGRSCRSSLATDPIALPFPEVAEAWPAPRGQESARRAGTPARDTP